MSYSNAEKAPHVVCLKSAISSNGFECSFFLPGDMVGYIVPVDILQTE